MIGDIENKHETASYYQIVKMGTVKRYVGKIFEGKIKISGRQHVSRITPLPGRENFLGGGRGETLLGGAYSSSRFGHELSV